MSQIADLIYNQMKTAGQPRTVTTTGTGTTETKSPLDLGSLGMLLYMMLSQGKGGGGGGILPGERSADVSPLLSLIPGLMPTASSTPQGLPAGLNMSQAPGGLTQMDPIAMLLKMFGGR